MTMRPYARESPATQACCLTHGAIALVMNVELQMFRVAIAAARTCALLPSQSPASAILESDFPTRFPHAPLSPPATD
jgi:hypothetical protein